MRQTKATLDDVYAMVCAAAHALHELVDENTMPEEQKALEQADQLLNIAYDALLPIMNRHLPY